MCFFADGSYVTVHTSGVLAYHKIVRRGIKNNEDVV